MSTVKIEQFKAVYQKGKTQVTGTFGSHSVTFFFGKTKTGFGYRHYFICPTCGEYRAILTFNGKFFTCFKCAGINPYSGIQTTTRGGDEFIMYKMERFAAKHGVMTLYKSEYQRGLLHYPFDYHDYKRPYRRNCKAWERTLKILQALESMRTQSIFSKKIWDVKTIRSVETGKNHYLGYPLSSLLAYLYPYDEKPINMSKFKNGAELFYDWGKPVPPDG